MKTSFEKYGRLDNHDLCEITLSNDQGMQVKVLNYGATLEKVLMPDGQNMIMSLASPADYAKERNFLGGTVGRICGRVRLGKWQHGEQTWQLPINDGKNHIHGGHGLDMEVWNFKLVNDEHFASTELTYFDPDGHNDFPGNLKLRATYKLDNENNLFYGLSCVSDQLTIFNPANHTYFTLGERAADLSLKLNADYYLPVAEDGLPIKGMASVSDTAFDFRKGKKISEALNSADEQIQLRHGLDHPFILNGNRPNAVLQGKHHKMVMITNAPAIVTYTGNHFDHSGVASNIGQYDGITLEAQCPPSATTDLGEITLLPFEKFERRVCWHFE